MSSREAPWLKIDPERRSVSINSTDFDATPLQVIFDSIQHQAAEAGVAVEGAELIGLIPKAALDSTDIPWLNLESRLILRIPASAR